MTDFAATGDFPTNELDLMSDSQIKNPATTIYFSKNARFGIYGLLRLFETEVA